MYVDENITAVVLAGGQGRRMGGVDKGWVEFRQQPLIEHVIQQIRPQVKHLLISANRSQARYEALGYPVISDIQDGFQGPLMGIASGLQAAATELVLFVPCDCPLLPEDLVARLYQALIGQEADVAVVHDGERLHPVVALLRKSLLDSALAALAAGDRKLERWYRQQRMVTVDFADQPAAFVNLNRPDDISALE